MASYRIQIKPSAAKEIEEIDSGRDRERIIGRIRALSANARPAGCEKLSGQYERYRIRVGRYRVVYAIEDDILLVYVVKVGHRKDVYR